MDKDSVNNSFRLTPIAVTVRQYKCRRISVSKHIAHTETCIHVYMHRIYNTWQTLVICSPFQCLKTNHLFLSLSHSMESKSINGLSSMRMYIRQKSKWFGNSTTFCVRFFSSPSYLCVCVCVRFNVFFLLLSGRKTLCLLFLQHSELNCCKWFLSWSTEKDTDKKNEQITKHFFPYLLPIQIEIPLKKKNARYEIITQFLIYILSSIKMSLLDLFYPQNIFVFYLFWISRVDFSFKPFHTHTHILL